MAYNFSPSPGSQCSFTLPLSLLRAKSSVLSLQLLPGLGVLGFKLCRSWAWEWQIPVMSTMYAAVDSSGSRYWTGLSGHCHSHQEHTAGGAGSQWHLPLFLSCWTGVLEPVYVPPPSLLHCVKSNACYTLKLGKNKNKNKIETKKVGRQAGDPGKKMQF